MKQAKPFKNVDHQQNKQHDKTHLHFGVPTFCLNKNKQFWNVAQNPKYQKYFAIFGGPGRTLMCPRLKAPKRPGPRAAISLPC